MKGAKETLVAEISERILELRAAHGMNQQQLAAALDISTSALRNIENGSASPRLYTLTRLSDVFDVPLDYIVRGITPGDNYDTWKQTGLDDAALAVLHENLELGRECGGLDEYTATLNRLIAGGFPTLVWTLNRLNRELADVNAEMAAVQAKGDSFQIRRSESETAPTGDDTAALLFKMQQGNELEPLRERRDLLKLRYIRQAERFFEQFIAKGDNE